MKDRHRTATMDYFTGNLMRKMIKDSEVFLSEPSGTRTRDPVIKSHMLYRPELTAHKLDGNWIITG
jgi:hypothetical protein